MTESTQDSAAAYATALLIHYCFELGRYQPEELVAKWFSIYPAKWVRMAIIEALYQGRYKAVSVEQILGVWYRRGQAAYHFNHEFERLVGRKFPQVSGGSNSEAFTLSFSREGGIIQDAENDAQESLEETITDSISPKEADSTELSISAAVTDETADAANSMSVMSQQLTDGETCASAEGLHSREANLTYPHSSAAYEANWSRFDVSKRPIHQFVPPKDDSEFYLKLKAVAQPPEIIEEAEEAGEALKGG